MLPQGVPLFANLPQPSPTNRSRQKFKGLLRSSFHVFSHMFTCFHMFVMFHIVLFHLSISFHWFSTCLVHITCRSGTLGLLGPTESPTATSQSMTNELLHAPLTALRLPLWDVSPWFFGQRPGCCKMIQWTDGWMVLKKTR